MLRGLILLIVLSGVALLVSPFLISSLYVDERGIKIPGRVGSKRETVAVHYSDWKRSSAAKVEFYPPDEAGVSFFNLPLDPEHYDALKIGETVKLHYLRRQDVPSVPFSKFLLEFNALPRVRLADQRTFSRLEAFFTGKVILICGAIAAFTLLVVLWRISRMRLLAWSVGICAAMGVAFLFIHDFPLPTPRPTVDLHQGSGRVKSLHRIDRLFQGSRQQGVTANQPVHVVGVEFVPSGNTEPVVAVDLIDAGSIAGLKENSTVTVEYEGRSPRTQIGRASCRERVCHNV